MSEMKERKDKRSPKTKKNDFTRKAKDRTASFSLARRCALKVRVCAFARVDQSCGTCSYVALS